MEFHAGTFDMYVMKLVWLEIACSNDHVKAPSYQRRLAEAALLGCPAGITPSTIQGSIHCMCLCLYERGSSSYSASKPLGVEEKKAELKAPARVLVFTRVDDETISYYS